MLRDFALDDQQWDSLLIPISLAFFFHSSSAGRVLAYYPSPAGATESLLDLEYWDAIAERNPVLKRMEPDVEALLVNRVSQIRRVLHRAHRSLLSPRRRDSQELARTLRRVGGVEADRRILRRPEASVAQAASVPCRELRVQPPMRSAGISEAHRA